jgi:hypothetical protein
MTKSNSKNVPVFWGHGKADPVVQYECESITNLAVRELTCRWKEIDRTFNKETRLPTPTCRYHLPETRSPVRELSRDGSFEQ